MCEDSLIAQLVNNLPAMQETPVRSLGLEEPLEKGKAFTVCIACAIGFVRCVMACILHCGITQSISLP